MHNTRKTVGFRRENHDDDEIITLMPPSPPRRMPPPMMFHQEHLANWHNEPRHHAYYYNGPWEKPKTKQPFSRKTSSIATLYHRRLCDCMSGDPRLAALHAHCESGMMLAPKRRLPTITEELPMRVQPPVIKRRTAYNKHDLVMPTEWIHSEEIITAKECLNVSSYPNRSERLNKKWLKYMFIAYPGFRGFTLTSSETRAHVYFNHNDEIRWARRNLQGIPVSGTQRLRINLVELLAPLEDTKPWWVVI